MGHKQPPTPIQTDNTTALGFVSKNLQPKAITSTDMKCWWMRDRSDRKQFRYYWGAGKGNRANYWTKHFFPAHHKQMRPSILTPSKLLNTLYCLPQHAASGAMVRLVDGKNSLGRA